jgi:hypothetical protein
MEGNITFMFCFEEFTPYLNFLAMQKKNITIIRNVGSYLANDTA